MTEIASKSRNPGLDLVRAVAIAMVLFWHSLTPLPKSGNLYFFGEFCGFAGVELFFVLSGYLIGGILLRTFSQPVSFEKIKTFWERRWLRTLPNYFVFLGINIAVWVWIDLKDTPPLWHFLFFLQGLFWPAYQLFNESWSLAVEEWFYLLTPFLALGFAQVRDPRIRKHAVLLAGLTLALVAFGYRGWMILQNGDYDWRYNLRKITFARFDVIILGLVIAQIHESWETGWSWLKRFGWIPGMILVTGVWRVYPHVATYPFLKVVVFTILALGFALCLPSLQALRGGRGYHWTIVQKVSLWSYSMYLVNNLVLRLLKIPIFDGMPRTQIVLFLVLTFVFSWLGYILIERTFLKFRDLKVPSERKPSLVDLPV